MSESITPRQAALTDLINFIDSNHILPKAGSIVQKRKAKGKPKPKPKVEPVIEEVNVNDDQQEEVKQERPRTILSMSRLAVQSASMRKSGKNRGKRKK